ncbi:Zinc finger BED domain-containing protein DAYSLEEPER [Striga hermonthica]|uniref:Zinc finger BED domain-containing protein DAYSLEEPER n=1 Tax=Striga hermonthica TaxID=68872 RepID=A0A9N7NXV8_STRHE|nr:Zinc finger BED domain-containing protein DAYSLEEPER [Striga hermonthica]
MADDSPTGGLPSTDDGSAASQTSKLKRIRPRSSSAAADATAGTGIAGAGNNTRRSIAWDHFKIIVVEDVTRAECKHCQKTYKCDTRRNGTSSLLHHISVCKAHPDVAEKKQLKLNLQVVAEGDDMVGSLTSWKFDQEAIRLELARMVVVDELPFRFVEGDGFKNFMSVTQPREWIASNDLDIKAMGEKMKSKYNKYWGDPKNVNHLIYVAVFVDPRYKLEFLEYALCEEHGEKNGSEIFKSVKGSVHELFEAYKLIYQPHCATSTQSTNRVSSLNESSHPDLSKNKSRYHLGDKFKRHKIESGEVESKCDLDVYLKESTLVVEKDDFDILRWWKLNQSRYPILSCFARDVLAIPISTVASESAFSTGGRVLDDYRSSLTPKIVEALICAQDWLKKKKSKWTKPLEESLEDIAKIEEALQGVGISDVNDNENTMDLEE